MVYLLKMVIFHGELLNNQMLLGEMEISHLIRPGLSSEVTRMESPGLGRFLRGMWGEGSRWNTPEPVKVISLLIGYIYIYLYIYIYIYIYIQWGFY